MRDDRIDLARNEHIPAPQRPRRTTMMHGDARWRAWRRHAGEFVQVGIEKHERIQTTQDAHGIRCAERRNRIRVGSEGVVLRRRLEEARIRPLRLLERAKAREGISLARGCDRRLTGRLATMSPGRRERAEQD
jgi:hypothetical protein